MNILAIESSCDETAAAVIRDRFEILSNVINTQIDTHKEYGGVVPEIASRMHIENISTVVDAAIIKAGIQKSDIDAVAVTYGPGLVGALLVGVSYAKAFAYALNKPLIPVHHIKGHISANYLETPDLKPPFICLVASGGHSMTMRQERRLIRFREFSGSGIRAVRLCKKRRRTATRMRYTSHA